MRNGRLFAALLFLFAFFKQSALAVEEIMVTTNRPDFEIMEAKCPELEKIGLEKGAPPYCAKGGFTLGKWGLTQPRPNECRIIPENGLKQAGRFAQNLGNGWRRWLATSFELFGNSCKNLHAFARANGMEADSGWYYVGSPIPNTTYYLSFAYPIDGPAERTPSIRPSHYPAGGNTVLFDIVVCKYGTPLNGCDMKTPSSGLPVAGSGVVPDITELTYYAVNLSQKPEKNSSEQLQALFEQQASQERLKAILQQQIRKDKTQKHHHHVNNEQLPIKSQAIKNEKCEQVYEQTDQEVRGFRYDTSICSQYSEQVDHYRRLSDKVVAACGAGSWQGKQVLSNARLAEEYFSNANKNRLCR